MSTLVNLVIRNAVTGDYPAASQVLLDALTDGEVARWAEPNPVLRVRLLRPFFAGLLQHTAAHGTIRLAQSEQAVVGVACWYAYPLPPAVLDVHAVGAPDPQTPSAEAAGRLGVLQDVLAARHPRHRRHDYLAYLAVSSTRQNRGIGTALLRDHHTHLDHTGTPAYLQAHDLRCHRLYQRVGYTDYGPPIIAAGSPPIWPMWHQPSTERP
jgi:GNAT superfamily N-acetyltransferase